MAKLEPTTIRILPGHITDSEMGVPWSCMVHDAVFNQLFPDQGEDHRRYVGVSHNDTSIQFPRAHSKVRITHDETVVKKIQQFDRGRLVKPFEFDIKQNEAGEWITSPARELPMPAVRNNKKEKFG